VYENASKALDHVWVATDDERIAQTVINFSGRVTLTSPQHPSGTDRCAEAYRHITAQGHGPFEVVINIQGDEPMVDIEHIEALKNAFDHEAEIATLITDIRTPEALFDPSVVKVIMNARNHAMYFSRSTIPFVRGAALNDWLDQHRFFRHLGMYAYRTHILLELTRLKPSLLELTESLEQLRWLEHGYRITCAHVRHEAGSIDTPDDLQQLLKTL
jgi:3-deoxy-manno-octulosonate cytidylyltransferase (CMP-KDO synthetase)